MIEKMKEKVSNTVMAKMLLHTQVETETIRGGLVSLTSDYVEEKIDELQVPSSDVAAEVRLTSVRSPIKAAVAAQWKATLRIQDQEEVARAAAANRAALALRKRGWSRTVVVNARTKDSEDFAKCIGQKSDGQGASDSSSSSTAALWWQMPLKWPGSARTWLHGAPKSRT